MTSYYIALLLVYFSGRVWFYNINRIVRLERLNTRSIIKRIIWGITLILLSDTFSAFVIIFFMHILLVIIDSYLIPRSEKRIRIFYSAHLFMALLFVPLLTEYLAGLMKYGANPVYGALQAFTAHWPMVIKNQTRFFLVLTGYFITLKEGTIFIRFILNRISVIPRKKTDKKRPDPEEYERGKLIGLLERTFIYFLIIFNQIGAIAVIIALKSLARFNELNDKDFAEYFLIGSLLSLLVAVLPAIIVRLISGIV